MADQDIPTIVKRMVDAGESEADIALVIQHLSHQAAPQAPTPVSTGGGRGTGLDVRKSDAWLKDSAPALGAALGVAAGPAGVIASPLMAMAGGAGGAFLRGDSAGDATVEGIKQGGMQVAGDVVGMAARPIARGLMKGTVPKNVAKEFQGQVNIPKEMLDRGVFPGVPASARRVEGLSKLANAERDAAATTVPAMPRSKIVAGLRPLHAEATLAKEPEIANAVLQQMRTSARDVGADGLSGPAQLARKTVKQRTGRAALTAGNAKDAAVIPQAADAERGAIVSHLRETPRMATALDESQAMMAIDQVMKDASLGNPITRMRIGGPTAVALTPAGLSATAHGINQIPKAMNPNVLRLLDMIMSQGSHQQ